MIPVSPAEFGKDWLERVLKAPPGTLRGMTATRVGTGQMCDSFRLALDWDGHDGPATIIAKCPSHDERSRFIAKALGNYDKEVRWYRELAGMSRVSKPHCHHAEIADDGVDFALLLGDCAPAVQADQVAGAGATRLRPAIAELAALHAPFWNSDIGERHPWLAKDTRAMIEAALPALAEGFAERYEGRLAPDILALARALAANIGPYLNREASAWSVVHGDFRLDNLLYAPDERVFVVDWQTVGIGCPFSDVAYLVGTSVADPDERAAIEAGLFDDYITALAGHGVVLGAAARAAGWQDYRVNALSGVLMAIFASMNVERTARGDEMFAVMAERPARQALALGSLGLIAA